MRRTLVSIVTVTCACALVVACRGKATREECVQAMDHYLDLVIAQDPDLAKLPPNQAATVREMKRELKVGDKTYRKIHDHCETDVSRSQVRCALGASSPSEWEACIP